MRTFINVHNIKCGECASTISKKLSSITGISEVEVNIDRSKVTFNCTTLDDAIIAKSTLKSLGYTGK